MLPCTSTNTAKLDKCVALHSTPLTVSLVDTPSSDQEFLYRNYLSLFIILCYNTPTYPAAKTHILVDLCYLEESKYVHAYINKVYIR